MRNAATRATFTTTTARRTAFPQLSPGNWRVQQLGPDGGFTAQWRNCLHGDPPCAFSNAGTDLGQFMESRGIAVDGQGTVYVADTDNQHVQRLMIVDWTLTPPPDPSGG